MLYFLYGDIPLELKYNELVKKIRTENPGITEKYYDGTLKEEEGFLQSLSTNSMFGGTELIVLKRLNALRKGDKFLNILENFVITNKVVIVTYEENLDEYGKAKNALKKTDAILKAATKLFKVTEARQAGEKKALLFYISNELNISEGESQRLLDMLDDNSALVRNEVEKIKLFLSGESFTFEKVEGIVSYSKDYNLGVLIGDFLSGNTAKLLNHLKHEKSYMGFLYALTGELDTLYKLKQLEKKGLISYSTSYNAFKDRVYDNVKDTFITAIGRPMHPYPLFLKFKLINKFKEDFLLNKLKEILDIEFKFKSGQGDEEILVESFIATFNLDK